MRLKARASVPISSGEPRTGTRASRSPAPTRSAASARRAIGATSWLASQSANQMATSERQQRHAHQHQVEAQLQAARALDERAIFIKRAGCLRSARQHGRIDLAADVDIAVGRRIKGDNSLDAVAALGDNGAAAGRALPQIDAGNPAGKLPLQRRPLLAMTLQAAIRQPREHRGLAQIARRDLELQAFW